MNFHGFSKLHYPKRLSYLKKLGYLTEEDIHFLKKSADPKMIAKADHFIENTIGCFSLPLGVAVNFCIDQKDYLIPMAVEETSIIAALSRNAKWLRSHGEIKTSIKGTEIIGQIQFPFVKNFKAFEKIIVDAKDTFIRSANEKVVSSLVARGGGVRDIVLRSIPLKKGTMAVVHVLLDPCDAMGANLVSQVCEFLKQPLEKLTGEKVAMCILSNLVDTKLTRVEVTIRDIDSELGQAIEEASLFAELDPYRAATHNKGIMNGIDPVLIATGNDWRAVEAGMHAYCARDGQYRAMATWRMKGKALQGELEAPIMVGTVGGVTQLHPMAQLSLRLMRITRAEELSRVIAAVGLVQNLGALRALVSEGIVAGHMKLHLNNLLMSVGVKGKKAEALRPKLEAFLKHHKKITESDVRRLL